MPRRMGLMSVDHWAQVQRGSGCRQIPLDETSAPESTCLHKVDCSPVTNSLVSRFSRNIRLTPSSYKPPPSDSIHLLQVLPIPRLVSINRQLVRPSINRPSPSPSERVVTMMTIPNDLPKQCLYGPRSTVSAETPFSTRATRPRWQKSWES